VSAGTWTTEFLSRRIGNIWDVADPLPESSSSTAYEKIDIGRRNADIGIRSERPVEPNLAGRLTGHVAHAIYAGRQLINGVKGGPVRRGDGRRGKSADDALDDGTSRRSRRGARGNDMHSVARAGGGGRRGSPYCRAFAGDSDKRLVQVAPPISPNCCRSNGW